MKRIEKVIEGTPSNDVKKIEEVIKGTPTNGVKKIEGVIKGTVNTKVATSCHGNICSIEGQFCPPTVPGSGGAGYCCKNKKWYSGSCKA